MHENGSRRDSNFFVFFVLCCESTNLHIIQYATLSLINTNRYIFKVHTKFKTWKLDHVDILRLNNFQQLRLLVFSSFNVFVVFQQFSKKQSSVSKTQWKNNRNIFKRFFKINHFLNTFLNYIIWISDDQMYMAPLNKESLILIVHTTFIYVNFQKNVCF